MEKRSEWEEITKHLPKGWEEKARETGALKRSRNIKSAEELFTVNMLYVANEPSLQLTSVLLKTTMGISLDKNAVYHRIKASREWLRWMAQEMCCNNGMTIPKPDFLKGKHVVLIDASDEPVKGSKKTDYRLHYAFDLFEFRCRTMELTSGKEGEKLTRYEVNSDEIYVCDRIYCTMSGIEHVLKNGGDFVIRYKSKTFNLYDESGERIEILPQLRGLKALENKDLRLYYKLPTGELRPLRIVAMKKDAKAIEQSKRKMNHKVSKKQEKAVQPDTVELNEYIVLATSLDYTNTQILELYRARWQIEQVFYRLKSMFGYDDVPSKNADMAQAWFYAKLLLGAICETILKRESFPPQWDSSVSAVFDTQSVE